MPFYNWFQWGGFLNQSGYKTGQLYGDSLAFGRLMYYHRIMKGTLLDGAYGGVSLELGRYGVPLLPDAPTGLLTSGSLFIGSDTPIGPAYLALWTRGGRQPELLLLPGPGLLKNLRFRSDTG